MGQVLPRERETGRELGDEGLEREDRGIYCRSHSPLRKKKKLKQINKKRRRERARKGVKKRQAISHTNTRVIPERVNVISPTAASVPFHCSCLKPHRNSRFSKEARKRESQVFRMRQI
ncbi:hypothetical protein PUN28_001022 [Cardiocondyla obscurior]|uniref:Uncharacterized protein n=1 Tax=Cardiocondyla obscurior TaxID=286306 RepID=A0AAW2H2K4_9HYME